MAVYGLHPVTSWMAVAVASTFLTTQTILMPLVLGGQAIVLTVKHLQINQTITSGCLQVARMLVLY